MIRLFVALQIPDEIRTKIIELRKQILLEGKNLRWEPKEKIHLTLKFIGDVEKQKIEVIKSIISFVENYKKFGLSLTKFGLFFNRHVPKILWMGLSENENLMTLVNELNLKLKDIDIPAENRKFKSHLTLLRIKNNFPESLIDKFENFNIPETSFICDTISLMESRLYPSGSEYSTIKNYELK